MNALLLTFGLSLLATLRAQAFPTMQENQDVSLRWAGASSGFMADRGAEVATWRPHSFSI